MDTHAAPDLSKELLQRTADLERHVKELRQQQEPRVQPRHAFRSTLAAVTTARQVEERRRTRRMEQMMTAVYPLSLSLSLSHDYQFYSSYVYFNTGFAMKMMHRRNRSTESVSEAIGARERAGIDGEPTAEEAEEAPGSPDTASRAPMYLFYSESCHTASCRREN